MMKSKEKEHCRRVEITQAADNTVLYCCPSCDMAFPETKILQEHLKTHNFARCFICTICGSALKRKEHHDRHTLEHNPDYRPHICGFCSKSFKRKDHLITHQRSHSTLKKEICSECGKGFNRKDHLRKHLQVHSKYREIPTHKPKSTYTCQICDKVFHRRTIFKQHLDIHIGSGGKIQICEECGVGFYNENMLRQHKCNSMIETNIETDSFTKERVRSSSSTAHKTFKSSIVKEEAIRDYENDNVMIEEEDDIIAISDESSPPSPTRFYEKTVLSFRSRNNEIETFVIQEVAEMKDEEDEDVIIC